jgi:hypothetical protein
MKSIKWMAAAAVMALALPEGAAAQTYGSPKYPFCLQNYSPVQYIECIYPTYEACQATASGRAAMCYENPYYAGPAQPRGRRAY